jgi:hypothetical protein
MPTNLSTITCQNILDYARAFTFLKPLLNIGGISNEPGMSICNDTLAMCLAKPFAFKFNRKEAPFFVTQGFIQNYLFAGACAFTLNPVVQSGGQSSLGGGGVGIDLASNGAVTQSGFVTTVQCLQPHNFTLGQTIYMNGVTDVNGNLVPGYNSVFTQNTVALSSTWSNGWVLTAFPTPTSFQFVSNVSGLAAGGSPGITDFGWLTDVSITDINNSGVPQPTGPIRAVDRIVPQYRCDETKELAVMGDLGNGVLQLRVGPNSDVYNMSVTFGYQMRAPLLKTPSSNWAPWPDRLAYVLRAGVTAFAYQLSEKSFAEKQGKMNFFAAMIQTALGYSDAEDQNLGFAPTIPIMR